MKILSQNKPFSIVNDKFSGFLGDIWAEIERSFKFESEIVLSTQYGAAPDKNNNWKGMIGMLHRNEAHVAVADFIPTPERNTVVDFTSEILTTGQATLIN